MSKSQLDVLLNRFAEKNGWLVTLYIKVNKEGVYSFYCDAFVLEERKREEETKLKIRRRKE